MSFKNIWGKLPKNLGRTADDVNNDPGDYMNAVDEGDMAVDDFNEDDGEQKDDTIKYTDIIVKSKKDIIIIVDPGHGTGAGNFGGSMITGYKHKVRGDDGKPKKDDKDKEIIITSAPEDLPEYVLPDLRKSAGSRTWIVGHPIQDEKKSEHALVLQVGLRLKQLLEKGGYTVYISRTTAASPDSKNEVRTAMGAKYKADYFLSIHADAVDDYRVKGSHTIYRNLSDATHNKYQKEFAADVFSSYTVVNTVPGHPKADERGLMVLSAKNASKRKTLVELGFVSNPDEYQVLISNVENAARQMAMGIDANVRKHYFTEEDPNAPQSNWDYDFMNPFKNRWQTVYTMPKQEVKFPYVTVPQKVKKELPVLTF
jgi:N-acetylmuramoyl-L-alanine amidase